MVGPQSIKDGQTTGCKHNLKIHMSFVNKYNTKDGLNAFSSDDTRKRKLSQTRNEEITSSDEDEIETAQEKKLRLAKMYLKELSRGDTVEKRLEDDYLKQSGKLAIAKEYTGINLNQITVLKCKEHRKAVTALCISTDSTFIYSGSKDGGLVKWSLNDKKKVLSLPRTRDRTTILSMALSSDSKFLAVGHESPDIHIWNPDSFQHINTMKSHRGAVIGLAFRKGTHLLYSSSKDRCVKVWTLDEMSYVETLYGHTSGITSIDALAGERALSADGGGGGDTKIRLWKIPEESQLIYNGASGSIDCVKFINEKHFISGGDAGELCVWGIHKKKALCVKKSNWITSLACLVNTDLIATGSNDGTVKLWRILEDYKEVGILCDVPVEGFVNALCFSNDGKYLIAGVGKEHRLGRWEVMNAAKNSIVIIPLQKELD